MWYKFFPERMGESAFYQFGHYEYGKKVGLWYKFSRDGELISKENYWNNVLDGEANYYEHGKLVATGKFVGYNPSLDRDTFYVEDPITGEMFLRSHANERGALKQGLWRFYNAETGHLWKEEEYEKDELVTRKIFKYSATDSARFESRKKNLPHNKAGLKKTTPYQSLTH